MLGRGKLLKLVAPGAIAVGVSTMPWAVQGSTEQARAPVASVAAGFSRVRVPGRLLRAEAPREDGVDYFSTKARSIT